MALWVLQNSVTVAFPGKGARLYPKGKVFNDAVVDISKVRAAGGTLLPNSDANAAAFSTLELKGKKKGRTALDGIEDRHQMGVYERKGAAVISALATSAAVAFAETEQDNNYFVLEGVQLSAGAAAGAERIYITNQSTTGFTINTQVAPGAGQSVTIHWLVKR